jgi:hypothetical protein
LILKLFWQSNQASDPDHRGCNGDNGGDMKKHTIFITDASSGIGKHFSKKTQANMNKIKLMKTLLLTTFLSSTLLVSKAQNFTNMENNQQDSITIRQALENYYFKGIYEGNVITLVNIFNPGTLLFGDVKGQPYAKTLDQYLDGVKNRQSPKDSGKPFKGTIISVDVVNSIAVAKVHVKMYEFNYDEFLSFHKIDNRWVIVNKMITDVPE